MAEIPDATDRPTVSIVIPCRNEERHIARCLNSVIANDYPHEDWEILVVDGMSTDGTRDILVEYSRRFRFIKMLDNPGKITPAAMNRGLRAARGEIIVRMDAHSTYAANYVSRCVKGLRDHDADNVGGVWIIGPMESTALAEAISLVLAHRLGVGNAHYRLKPSEPREVDTVPFGCYRREVFDRIGLFDENLRRGQDMDFNRRLVAAGGKILLLPDVICYYHPRTDLWAFVKHNFWNGIWVFYPMRFGAVAFSLRHLVPGLFVGVLFATLGAGVLQKGWVSFAVVSGAYLAAAVGLGVLESVRRKKVLLMLSVPLGLAALHLAYGLGTFVGLAGVLWRPRFWRTLFGGSRPRRESP